MSLGCPRVSTGPIEVSAELVAISGLFGSASMRSGADRFEQLSGSRCAQETLPPRRSRRHTWGFPVLTGLLRFAYRCLPSRFVGTTRGRTPRDHGRFGAGHNNVGRRSAAPDAANRPADIIECQSW